MIDSRLYLSAMRPREPFQLLGKPYAVNKTSGKGGAGQSMGIPIEVM
jgi:hypothetical protein